METSRLTNEEIEIAFQDLCREYRRHGLESEDLEMARLNGRGWVVVERQNDRGLRVIHELGSSKRTALEVMENVTAALEELRTKRLVKVYR